MAALNPYFRLVWENLIFLSLGISFFAAAGYAWRNSQPFEIPKPLPSWFQTWLSVVLVVGIVLPVVATAIWGIWQRNLVVVIVFASYLVMLGLQIVIEIIMSKRFKSPIWVTVPCLFLTYRFWQLYEGITLVSPDANLIWVKYLLILELALWIFNYGVHLSQLPRLLRWTKESES
jgi:hypothetical protein